MAIRVAIDLGLFRITALADGKPVTATKLAEKTKGEKLLIGLLRPQTCVGQS